MKIAELFASLGYKVDTTGLDMFSTSLGSTRKKTLKLSAAITAAIFLLDRFIDSSVRGAVALSNFTIQTGLLSDQLQRFQIAGQLSDISLSVDQITSSIRGLQSKLADIKLGGGNIFPFQLLGISVKGKDAFEVLEEVRDRIKGLSPDVAVNILSKLGLGPGFLNVLKLSREEFNKLGDSITRTEKGTDELVKLGTAITNLKLNLSLLKDIVLGVVSPIFISLLNIVTSITRVFFSLGRTLPVISGGIAILAISFAPVTSAILALILVLEDLFVFFRGGESLTGNLINGIKSFTSDFLTSVMPIMDFFIKLKEIIEGVSELGLKQSSFINNIINKAFGIGSPTAGIQGIQGKNQVSIRNNFTFNTMESDERLTERVVSILGRQGSSTFSELNNGVLA